MRFVDNLALPRYVARLNLTPARLRPAADAEELAFA